MIVQSAQNQTGKVALPDLAQVLDLSENVGADAWMAEGGTDLLSGQRWRSVRNLFIVLLALAAVGVGIFMLVTMKNGEEKVATNTTPIDAAVRRQIEAKPDASELSHDDIRAISKFGFFSIDSQAKATIYVDNVRLGDTPIERAPLQPGPHKVRAVTKGKKPKDLDITIIGGRDTDEGLIQW